MFDTAPDEDLTVISRPDLMAELRHLEGEISARRARQLRIIRELGRRSWHGPDSSTIASQLDIAPATAYELVRTAPWMAEGSAQMARLESGEWSFDRTRSMARLAQAGADGPTMEEAETKDVAGIDRLRARTNRIRRRDERQAHRERHVRATTSLDQSVGFLSVQLSGHDWAVVTKALDERADRLPGDAHRASSREQLRADALVAIAHDSLEIRQPWERARTGPVVTVVVDAATAAASGGEAGSAVVHGPRVGPDTLDEILCEGSVEVVVDRHSGMPLAVGPSTRVVPPKMRRFVVGRDGGCTIDGCGSDYRLEVHHIVPRSRGGDHDPANLTTLCWWHHHVAVHRHGGQIDPESPPGRRRIIPDGRGPP